MKYKLYLTFAALALCNALSAQNFLQPGHLDKYTREILARQQTSQDAAAKGTSQRERQTAFSATIDMGGGSYEVWDTIHYKYTGLRGNLLDNGNFYSYWDNGNGTIFDGLVAPPGTLLYDTATVLVSLSGPGSTQEMRLVKKYNTSGDLTAFYRQYPNPIGSGTIVQQERYLYTYNANHKCTFVEQQEDASSSGGAGLFVTMYTLSSKYDAQNRIIADSFYDINGATPDQKTSYAYYTNGLPQQIIHYNWDFNNNTGWIPDSSHTFIYDASNRLMRTLGQGWNGTAYSNAWKDTFTYTGAAMIASTQKSSYWATNAYQASFLTTVSLTPALAPDTTKYYSYNGATTVLASMYKDQYTALNHINHRSYYQVIGGVPGTIPSQKYTFYYESYNDATGITVCPSGPMAFSLYPNPATDEVHLQFGALPPHEATVSVYAFDGRLMQRQTIPAQISCTLSTKDLPAGNYMVEVVSGSEQQGLRMSVVK